MYLPWTDGTRCHDLSFLNVVFGIMEILIIDTERLAVRTGVKEGFFFFVCFLLFIFLKMLAWEDYQFSGSVLYDSLQSHESPHARPLFPPPTPGIYSNSCPLSWWYHPAISTSVIPFSSCRNVSHHQYLFQWVNPSHAVAKVLEFKCQHQSFRWTPRADLL